MPLRDDFRSHYGPWALVAGAAVGLGAEYARQLATHGLNLILVDRDEQPLQATARALSVDTGVTTLPVVADLARADIASVVGAAVDGRELGLLVYNAAIGSAPKRRCNGIWRRCASMSHNAVSTPTFAKLLPGWRSSQALAASRLSKSRPRIAGHNEVVSCFQQESGVSEE